MDHLHRYLWDRHWQPICHRSEVANRHDFVRFEQGGEEVVAFNDGTSVIVFDNLCPHRGARIFDGDRGSQRFLCRYHGWSFSNGRVLTGNRDLFPAETPPADVARYQTCWVGDLLFCARSPSSSIEAQLAGLAPTIEKLSRDMTRCSDFNRYEYQSDWRVAIENALEPYHIDAIHPTSLGTLKLGNGENSFFGANSIWQAPLENETMAKRLRRMKAMFDTDFDFEGYWSVYLFPFSMISTTFGYSYSFQSFLPSDKPERCHFTSRFYEGRLRASLNPDVMADFFRSAAEVNRQVFDEDHAICRRVPLRGWTPEPPLIAAKSEVKILHFRESYRNCMAAA